MTPDPTTLKPVPEEKHPGGRPSEYDPSVCHKLVQYVGECQDFYDGQRVQVKLPKREGFAKYLGVTRQTLDNWANQHPEFFDALSRLDAEQKERLIDNGLAGHYNPTIAKLLLSANHGMAEKSQQDITSGGEKVKGFVVELTHANPQNPHPGSL